jgi:catechol 2,3-dioxygenase-like lactoylglutathione lyase family enzyme
MKIRLESVFVSDLDGALAFYTNVLGFVKKRDIPMGETRYVTVVSPDEPDGTELLLEPNGEHPPTKAFKQALYEEGIPLTAFLVDDIAEEYRRLTELGVEFRGAPQRHGNESMATLDDTCGNLIMLYQTHSEDSND